MQFMCACCAPKMSPGGEFDLGKEDCDIECWCHEEHPVVQLTGENGNAFAVMGRVLAGLRGAGAPPEVTTEYTRQAMSGDYDNLLDVSARFVDAR